jgi:hypothetical protein
MRGTADGEEGGKRGFHEKNFEQERTEETERAEEK